MQKKIFWLFLLGLGLSISVSSNAYDYKMQYRKAIRGSDSSSMRRGRSPQKVNLPTANKLSPNLIGTDAIQVANRKATRKPNSSGYNDSIMTFDYKPGALYQIYAAPLCITDIEFEEREHVVSVAAGDTLRWQVSKTFSGFGAKRHEHLLIKPMEAGLNNTLVVTTDSRTYHLLLCSKDKVYMPVVAWHYANIDDLSNNSATENTGQLSDLAHTLDIDHLDFHYKIKLAHGPRPEWMPTLVFNDGNKTYIKLPQKIQEAPMLFIGSSLANGQIINYRVAGNYYVVDSLFPEAILSAGSNNQIVVEISYLRH
jgi:type IV secretion system protein TrbG